MRLLISKRWRGKDGFFKKKNKILNLNTSRNRINFWGWQMNDLKKAGVFFVIHSVIILYCVVGLSQGLLRVTQVDPPNGTTNFPFFQSMTINFSADLNLATVDSESIFLTDPSGHKVPCRLTKSGRRIILELITPLSPGTTYTIHVAKAVQDVGGNSLTSEFTSAFTTGVL